MTKLAMRLLQHAGSLFSYIRGYPLILLFALVCFMFYEHAMRTRNADLALLLEQRESLVIQRTEASAHQEKLLLQINSQSDPAWVELTLMKGLGLVPDGQTKVFFRGEG
jgi:hypothetical protein